jgi:hypothetical protein
MRMKPSMPPASAIGTAQRARRPLRVKAVLASAGAQSKKYFHKSGILLQMAARNLLILLQVPLTNG